MAQIPDFKNVPEDERWDTITRVLTELNKDANKPLDINLGDNVLLDWVDNGIPLPDGYRVADGRNNGTFNASASKIIKIQKV